MMVRCISIARTALVPLLALLMAQGAEGQFFRDVEWMQGGQLAPANRIHILPDRRIVLTEDNRIAIYDGSLRTLGMVLRPEGALYASAILPGGNQMITGGNGLTVWDLTEGRRLRDIAKRPERVWAMDVSADGRFLAIGQGASVHGEVSTITLYQLPEGNVHGVLPYKGEKIGTLAFTASGDTLVSSDCNGWTYVWDVARRVALDSTFHSDNSFGAAALSPDGHLLVTVGDHRMVDSVEIFDLRQGLRRVHASFGFELIASSTPRLFRFSSDGRYLAVGLDSWAVSVWETETWTEVSRVNVSGILTSVEFSPYNGDLLTGTWIREEVRIWPKEKWERQGTQWVSDSGELLTPCGLRCSPVVVSPDGTYVASSNGGWIYTFDASTGVMTGTFRAPGTVVSLRFTPDSRRLVVFGHQQVTIWPVEGFFPEPIATRAEPGAWGSEATYSRDGRYFAGSSGTDVRLWNTTVDTVLRIFPDTVSGEITFSPDGRRVGWGTRDTTVRIWNAETGELEQQFPKRHTGAILSAQYSPDGTRMATTANDGRVIMWDVAGEESIWQIQRESRIREYRKLRFSPDGEYLFVGGFDSTVVVFDARTGDSVDAYDSYSDYMDGVVWIDISPDGRRLVVGGLFMLVSYRTRQGWIAGVDQERGESRSASAGARLGACVPNPSRRGEVVIPFTLLWPMTVRLVVIDTRGNEVGVVVQGDLRAGSHQATFSCRGLPAGTYYYSLETDDGRMALPMSIQP